MRFQWPDYAGFVSILEDILWESASTPLQFRDEGLLRSAFARPQNLMDYEPGADVFDIAATLAFGCARNPALVDGNKPAAAVAFMITLLLNGLRLDTSQGDVTRVFQALADGQLCEADLASWARERNLQDTRFLEHGNR
jgi:death-on-curing protein